MTSDRRFLYVGLMLAFICFGAIGVEAQQNANLDPGQVQMTLDLEGENFTKAVKVFLLITALSLAPSFIMMMTSFTRIMIVLSFLRQALRTQQIPSTQIIAGLALFLTFFIMKPTWDKIYNNVVIPYSQEEMTQTEAFDTAGQHMKEFMLKNTRKNSLLLFMDAAGQEPVSKAEEVPMRIAVPSFIVSELQTAFQMGFLLYLPFLVIDAVVATFLMSMGMIMLPPMMISLPFKLLLFVMVDGWSLVMRALLQSFGGL